MTNDRRYNDVLINLEAAVGDLEILNTELGTGPNYTRKFEEEIEDLKVVIGYVKATKPKGVKTKSPDDDEEDSDDRLEEFNTRLTVLNNEMMTRMSKMEELIVGLAARVGHAARQKPKRPPSKKK